MNVLEKLIHTLRHYSVEEIEALLSWLDSTPHCASELYCALAESYRKRSPLGYQAFCYGIAPKETTDDNVALLAKHKALFPAQHFTPEESEASHKRTLARMRQEVSAGETIDCSCISLDAKTHFTNGEQFSLCGRNSIHTSLKTSLSPAEVTCKTCQKMYQRKNS